MTSKPIGHLLALALTTVTSDRLSAAPTTAPPATPSFSCEREAAGGEDARPAGHVLYAVGLTETGRRESLQPFAMNIEGKARLPRTWPKRWPHSPQPGRKGQG